MLAQGDNPPEAHGGSTPKTPCPGSGLGLAIVTAVAATHHGTAQASLNEPHGLRVTLTLPATDAATDAPADDHQEPA